MTELPRKRQDSIITDSFEITINKKTDFFRAETINQLR